MSDTHDDPPIDWETRFQKVKRECFELFDFVYTGEESGRITKEASKAYYRKCLEVEHRAGFTPSTSGGEPDLIALWAVLRQRNYESSQALLEIQPELREALMQAVPSLAGRVR